MKKRKVVLVITTCAVIYTIAGAGRSPAIATETSIRMLNKGPDHPMQFDPELVRIAPGDNVHFVAVDKDHYAQTIPGMLPDGAQSFVGTMGQDLTVKFTVPGVYGYRCTPHGAQGMVGLIVVGSPVNESTAKQVPVSGIARRTFDKLFDELDRTHGADAAPAQPLTRARGRNLPS